MQPFMALIICCRVVRFNKGAGLAFRFDHFVIDQTQHELRRAGRHLECDKSNRYGPLAWLALRSPIQAAAAIFFFARRWRTDWPSMLII
jgi:hypothetical protein